MGFYSGFGHGLNKGSGALLGKISSENNPSLIGDLGVIADAGFGESPALGVIARPVMNGAGVRLNGVCKNEDGQSKHSSGFF